MIVESYNFVGHSDVVELKHKFVTDPISLCRPRRSKVSFRLSAFVVTGLEVWEMPDGRNITRNDSHIRLPG